MSRIVITLCFFAAILNCFPVFGQREKTIEVDLAMEICHRSDIYTDVATLTRVGSGSTFRWIPYLLKLNTEDVFLSYADTMYTLDSLGIKLFDRETFGKYGEMENNKTKYNMIRFKSAKFRRRNNVINRHLNKTTQLRRVTGWRKKYFDGYFYLALYRMKIRVRDTSRIQEIYIVNLFKNRKLKGRFVRANVQVIDILEIIEVKPISAQEYLNEHSRGNRVRKFIKRTLGVGQVAE